MISKERGMNGMDGNGYNKAIPASRSKLSKANSVALEPDRGALPVTTRKFDTFSSEMGFDGIRKEVSPIHTPRTTATVVRNENTPFSLCIVVCILR
jgi:hypothetical protein